MNLCFLIIYGSVYALALCKSSLEEGYCELREQCVSKHVFLLLEILIDLLAIGIEFGLKSVSRTASNALCVSDYLLTISGLGSTGSLPYSPISMPFVSLVAILYLSPIKTLRTA